MRSKLSRGQRLLRLRFWFQFGGRGLFEVSAGGAVELFCKSVHLCLRAKLGLFCFGEGVCVQSWFWFARRFLPGVSAGVFHLGWLLRDLPDKLGLQLCLSQLRVPLGIFHQPVGDLRQEVSNKRSLQYYYPNLRLSSGLGQGQRGLPDLSSGFNAHSRRQRVFGLQSELGFGQWQVHLPVRVCF